MLKNTLKVALKVLLRRKFFTAVSLFGIGFTLFVLLVATAMLDHSFRPQPPEVHGDRLLIVSGMSMVGPRASRSSNAGYGFLDRWVRPMAGPEIVSVTSRPAKSVGYQISSRDHSRHRPDPDEPDPFILTELNKLGPR